MLVAFVLAGGLGTRLRSVVSDVPKPMAEVSSRPFLEWLFDYWIDQGVTKFVVCLGYKHEIITTHFGNSYRGCEIDYSIEDRPLGTGGALLNAMRNMPQQRPFILLNGDTFFPVSANDLMKESELKKFSIVFSIFISDENDRYGRVKVNECDIISCFNGGKANIGDYANGGVYAINPALFPDDILSNFTSCSFEGDILVKLQASGKKFYGLKGPKSFIDIGVPRDYARAASVIEKFV